MEETATGGLLAEVRDFLAGFRRELPELFRVPKPPAPVRRRPSGASDSARALIEGRVAHWAGLMELKPNRIFMKNQRSLWGSCSTKGNLNFNRVLADAPVEVLDYVVIHELAHLREMNHSKRFWAVVAAWCPEHRPRRRWLRENSHLLRPGPTRRPLKLVLSVAA
mgnify:FL=1